MKKSNVEITEAVMWYIYKKGYFHYWQYVLCYVNRHRSPEDQEQEITQQEFQSLVEGFAGILILELNRFQLID